jgi:hypothetical protein
MWATNPMCRPHWLILKNAVRRQSRGRSRSRFRGIGAVARAAAIGVLLLAGLAAADGEGAASGSRGGEPGGPPPVRFFAVGDLPYGQSEVAPLQALLNAAAAQHPPFIAHVGDIKAGSTPCTDANLHEIAGIFRALPVPVAYTPGDNEWTDCHRPAAGGLDPRVRLARVREVFFGDPTVLRLAALGAVPAAKAFPEIYAFQIDAVAFISLHIVGSNNGFSDNDPAAAAEFAAREAANTAFLNRALESAKAGNVRALVLMIQANPLFDRGQGPPGFRGFKQQLVAAMARFAGPVLVLHGDTHRFRHDRPLIDPVRGTPFARLVRIEVPGSPVVGGVWITVDPSAPEPFRADPVYAVSLDSLN